MSVEMKLQESLAESTQNYEDRVKKVEKVGKRDLQLQNFHGIPCFAIQNSYKAYTDARK